MSSRKHTSTPPPGAPDRGGPGRGKGHTPREAKDNLKSTQMMSVI
ncbi:hypothetical protein, partial [Escherichia coli]